MTTYDGSPSEAESESARAEQLFERHKSRIHRQTDRLFAFLLAFEWMTGLAVAQWISPRTWAGGVSQPHPHVWMAAILGGALVSLPIGLCLLRPGRAWTRHAVAAAQMGHGALLVHLTGGRIEMHFHIFGSLALLAFYRDWRVLLTASAVVMVDHVARGFYWPLSIYGVAAVEPWRWLEHGGWVVFENVFLIRSCQRSIEEMKSIALRQARLEATHDRIEREVEERTAELRESESSKAAIFRAALDAIVTVDQGGLVVEFNPAAEQMFGYPNGAVGGMPLSELIVPQFRRPAPTHADDLVRFLATGDGGVEGRVEYTGARSDGAEFPVEVAAGRSQRAGATVYTAFVRDISERRRNEERLTHLATHDSLTGLPNRALLHARMDEAIGNGQAGRPRPAALLLVDLDRFKEINDTFGHHYGDIVLRRLVPRLRDAVGASDTVARIGGDEFAVLLTGEDVSRAAAVAEAVVNAVSQPLVVDGHALDVGASVGIAFCPEHAQAPTGLLQCADVAMYAAKRARAGSMTYSAEQSDMTPRRLTLISELRRAIEADQLVLHYQPKIDLRTGRATGCEALVRWSHPREGLVPPAEFLPLAEHAGLMRPMSLWVLNAALAECRAWRASGFPIGVAVNLATDSLSDPFFIANLVETLDAHEAGPAWLTLEITETAMMVDPKSARESLVRLHELGVKTSIDDFGTGYSSLAYLKDLPVDEVKIDRSFLKGIAAGGPGTSIVRAIVELGHTLGLQVVAEGVEDDATGVLLRSLGCDTAQGFHYSRPIPAAEFIRWLKAQPEPKSPNHAHRADHAEVTPGRPRALGV